MANLLRRDRRLRGKDISLPPPSQRYPRKSMPLLLVPNALEKLRDNNLSPSQNESPPKQPDLGKSNDN